MHENCSKLYSSIIPLSHTIDYSHIVLIIAIWPGDRIRRPEHSTVEHGSCDESVQYFSGTNFALITKILHTYLPFYI